MDSFCFYSFVFIATNDKIVIKAEQQHKYIRGGGGVGGGGVLKKIFIVLRWILAVFVFNMKVE